MDVFWESGEFAGGQVRGYIVGVCLLMRGMLWSVADLCLRLGSRLAGQQRPSKAVSGEQ